MLYMRSINANDGIDRSARHRSPHHDALLRLPGVGSL
jgi:hypothetical protein